jgi:hypothetical protein
VTTETIVAPAAAANKDRMKLVIDARAESRAMGDRMRAASLRARTWLSGVFKTLHLDGLGTFARTAMSRGKSLLARLGGIGRYFGWENIAGTVLTAGGFRDGLRTVLAKSYRVLTFPVRLVGRGLAWALNKTSWGAKAVTTVSETVAKGEAKVAAVYAKGEAWMDAHEHSSAMSWARSYFQFRLVTKGLFRVLPRIPAWARYIVALSVPILGLRSNDKVVSTASAALTLVKDTAQSGADAVEAAKAKVHQFQATPQPESVEQADPVPADIQENDMGTAGPTTYVLVRDISTNKVHQASTWEVDGVKRYLIEGNIYDEAELPENYEPGHVEVPKEEAIANAVAEAIKPVDADKAAAELASLPREVRREAVRNAGKARSAKRK